MRRLKDPYYVFILTELLETASQQCCQKSESRLRSEFDDMVKSPIQKSPIRGIVAFNFSPRNLTQVTSAMKPGLFMI